MKCGNCWNCNGKMVIKTEPGLVPLAAHILPVFAQCDECGYAPLPDDQPGIVSRLLIEHLAHGEYVRGKTYCGDY